MEKIIYVMRPDLTFSVLYQSSTKLNPSARDFKSEEFRKKAMILL